MYVYQGMYCHMDIYWNIYFKNILFTYTEQKFGIFASLKLLTLTDDSHFVGEQNFLLDMKTYIAHKTSYESDDYETKKAQYLEEDINQIEKENVICWPGWCFAIKTCFHYQIFFFIKTTCAKHKTVKSIKK